MAAVNQEKIEHTIGEPIFMMASAPIQVYDQLTDTWSDVNDAQGLGYVPSAKMRYRNSNGTVVGTFSLTWPSAALWRLKLDTTGSDFKPGEYSADLKILSPDGDAVFSEKRIFVLDWADTR